MSQETQQSPYEKLAEGLPADQKAEYFKTLHEIGISPEDIELARLLKALQLYKAYYESIPKAVTDSADKIDKLGDLALKQLNEKKMDEFRDR